MPSNAILHVRTGNKIKVGNVRIVNDNFPGGAPSKDNKPVNVELKPSKKK